jgi:pyruvate-formate lyase-activating enzyme
LSLFIPGLVESDELESIAQRLAVVDGSIPFTILAFFPEYRMKAYKSPSVTEMIEAYHRVKATGLKNIRLGNIGVFARTKEDQEYLMDNVGDGAIT